MQISRRTKRLYLLPVLFSFFVFSGGFFLSLFIVNFPLIGANFLVLLFLNLTGGLNKLTKAAQLCRNLPTLINVFAFFCITPKFTLLLLPAAVNSYSSISCSVFFVFNSVDAFFILQCFFFFHIFPPLFSSLSAYIHIFLCLLSISPLTRPVSLDHAFHYSAASIDLLSGWSAIDYNTCFSATELRRYCCAKIGHINTRTSAHTFPLSSFSSAFFFLPPFQIHFKTFGNALGPFFIFSSSPLTLHLGIHRHIDSALPQDICLHVQFLSHCFGTDC